MSVAGALLEGVTCSFVEKRGRSLKPTLFSATSITPSGTAYMHVFVGLE